MGFGLKQIGCETFSPLTHKENEASAKLSKLTRGTRLRAHACIHTRGCTREPEELVVLLSQFGVFLRLSLHFGLRIGV